MKKLFLATMVLMMMVSCGALRMEVKLSADELVKWTALFQERLGKTPAEQIKPFTQYFIIVIGQDKMKLPAECMEIINDVQVFIKDKTTFTDEERGYLMGKWDRFFLVILENASTKIIDLVTKALAGGM